MLWFAAAASPPSPAPHADAMYPVEVSASLGAQLGGYPYFGGVAVDAFVAAGAGARAHLGPRGGLLESVIVSIDACGLVPVRGGGLLGGVSVLRGGLATRGITASAGVHVQVEDAPTPLFVLPSLQLTWQPGPLELALGVLDEPLGPLAHVSIAYRGFGVGFAAPVGGELFARVRVRDWVSLAPRAYGFRLLNTFNVGVVFTTVFALEAPGREAPPAKGLGGPS